MHVGDFWPFLQQAISFPVHSMGWIDVDEDSMANERLAETVNECIASLAEQRKDLWVISETWGEVRTTIHISDWCFKDSKCMRS